MSLTIKDFAAIAQKDGFVKLSTFSNSLTRYGDSGTGLPLAHFFRGPSADRLKEVRQDLLNAIRLEFGNAAAEKVRDTLLGADVGKPLSSMTVRSVILTAASELNKSQASTRVDRAKLLENVQSGLSMQIAAAGVKMGLEEPALKEYAELGTEKKLSDLTVAIAIKNGIGTEELGKLADLGLDGKYMRMAMTSDVRAETISSYTEHGMSKEYAITTLAHGIDLEAMTDLMKTAGVKEENFGKFIKFYSDYNLLMMPETMVTGCVDENVKSKEFLGAGGLNQVFKIEYKAEGDKPGRVGVFKPMRMPDLTGKTEVESGEASGEIGINLSDPQNIMRNIATSKVAQLLGFDVIPKIEVAIHDVPYVKPSDPKKEDRLIKGVAIGIVMDLAPGVTAKKVRGNLSDSTDYCREVTKLQLLDQLVGQSDRHSSNYLVHQEPKTGRVKVTGIDNDQCFGSRTTHPEHMAVALNEKTACHGVRLPFMVDTEMVQAFRNLKMEDLEGALKGKLSSSEIDATKQRLEVILDHFDQLEAKGQVISPEKWGSGGNLGHMRTAESSSYYGRDYNSDDDGVRFI